MMTKAQKRLQKLFEVADSQQGFFTAKQAERAGYLPTNFTYHVQNGGWIKEGWGIYRLRHFPASRESQYVQLSLWSRNRADTPQGVISHLTALSLHEISDANPSKIHMTMPTTFRRSAKTPKELVIHYSDLEERHIDKKIGYQITKPLKTLIDVFVSGLSLEHVEKGLHDALKKALITPSELKSPEIPHELQTLFDQWIKDNRRARRVRA